MKRLDFDVNTVRKNTIELLDCQIDLILKSLELYAYNYQYLYPRVGKTESKEENLRKSLVNDTYEQILCQFVNSKDENPVISNNLSPDENFIKKIYKKS